MLSITVLTTSWLARMPVSVPQSHVAWWQHAPFKAGSPTPLPIACITVLPVLVHLYGQGNGPIRQPSQVW